jgi:subtilase family serine protease
MRHARPAAAAAAALLATAVVGAAVVPSAFATAGSHPGGMTRVIGTVPGLAGSSAITAAQAAPASVPSTRTQISVLANSLKLMQEKYTKFDTESPGPEDVFDYDVGPLWLKGIDGAGTTVAVVEGWSYTNIAKVVASFDKPFDLPNPVIQTIYPSGDHKLPSKCPAGMVALGSYGSCSGWAGELILDVEAAHLMAPYAKILIAVAPADSQINDDPASNVAPPEMMQAFETIAKDHLANVISDSDGSGEASYSHGTEEISAQDPGELAAAAAGIPVCIATGDTGVVQTLPSYNGDKVSSYPDTGTWDDSPWVTAVGGTTPDLSSTGTRLGPDYLWHVDGYYSEAAGYSSVFARPFYQNSVAAITHSDMRTVPDITLDSTDGTSEAGPLLAGILALATQVNHANVGPINPALYGILGPKGAADGIIDVTSGNDSYETPSGHVIVPGFTAAKGFDIASGWGTIYAPEFVPSLVAATKDYHQEQTARTVAQAQLTALEHAVTLSPDKVAAGGVTYLLAGGFLPGHPVQMLVDNHLIATLTATVLGTVTYSISPGLLKLANGSHSLELQSMLIDETASFSSS